MARILIAGAGAVGSATGLRLVAVGHRVYGARRSAARLPAGLVPVAVDFTRARTLGELPRAVDHLVYCAAPDTREDRAYRAVYVEGLCNVLERTTVAGTLLYVSSTSVYGQQDGSWVDEDTEAVPEGFAGQRLLEGEALARGAAARRVVVVRFAGIYGPGREYLLDRVRSGSPCRARPSPWTNRIHQEDCAGVLCHLLGLERPAPLYLGCDGVPATQCEVMDWIARCLGRPPVARRGAPPGAPVGKRCGNARLVASGYRLAYPSYREGYQTLCAGAQRA